MRLKTFRVTNYKSIEDSGTVATDSNVTCLLGKNESGKSAVLQALWKFNNVAGVKYDPLFDLPAERYRDLRNEDPEVVALTFTFEETDSKEFQHAFPEVTVPDEVTVRSTYKGTRRVECEIAFPQTTYAKVEAKVTNAIRRLAKAAEGLPEGADLTAIVTARSALEALASAGRGNAASEIPAATLDTAINGLKALREGSSDAKLLESLQSLKTARSSQDPRQKFEQWLLQRLPIFIYFEDYGRLRTRIHLPQFLSNRSNAPKDAEEKAVYRTQQALFELARIEPKEILELGSDKRPSESQDAVNRRKDERSRLLESASFRLTGDWLEWWESRTHRLNIGADGNDLELRVSDDINPWHIPFGDRSRGFQWFFSFYLTFLVESGKAHRGAILLLDEPGLHLHMTQQLKLLRFFQKVSKDNQILYSSHSPFMVDPDRVDNVRTVFLEPRDKGSLTSRAYTRVSLGTEPDGDRDTLLPLQAAGAYQLAQTLFLGKRTLIVEGVSDYWLLKILSIYLQEHGGGELHDDIVLVWAGGTKHMIPLASILAARAQVGPNHLAVLFDSDKVGKDRASKLVEQLLHGDKSILLLGDILGISEAEIEDVVQVDELLSALAQLGRTPTTTLMPNPDETNVPFLKRLFAANGWGTFEHAEKARMILALVDGWRSEAATPAPETLDRARVLFETINTRFQELSLL